MRLRIATQIGALLTCVVTLATACGGQAGDEPTPTETPVPISRSDEIVAILENLQDKTFRIVYDDETSPTDVGQTVWTQRGASTRWDRVDFYQGDDLPGGTSVMIATREGDDAVGKVTECTFGLEDSLGEVNCDLRNERKWLLQKALGEFGFRAFEVVSANGMTLLDRELTCFSLRSRGYLLGGKICVDAGGLVLYADVGSDADRGVFTAVSISEPESDFLKPIVPGLGLFRDVPLDEMTLPSIPILDDFLESGAPSDEPRT